MLGGPKKLLVGLCLLVGCSGSGASGNQASGGAGSGSGGSATLGVAGASGSSAGSMSSAGNSSGSGGGAATMPPLVADPNGNVPQQLQLSGGYLYWISGTHQIVRAAVDGTQVKTLFTHPGTSDTIVAIGGFAVDAQALYFTNEGDSPATDRGVYKLALDGSGAPTKLTDGTQPSAIALDGDTLCFTDGTDLRQVKTSGDSPLTLLRGGFDYRTTLLVSQGFVYFPNAFGAQAQDVYRLPLGVADPSAAGGSGGAGGAAAGSGGGGASGTDHNGAQKVSAVPGRYDILLASRADNGDIYWGVEETIYKWSGSAGGASSVAVVSDPLRPEATAPPDSVLVPSNSTLYWVSDALTSGTIFKQALPGGMRTLVAPLPASSLALDQQYVYAGVIKGINRYPR